MNKNTYHNRPSPTDWWRLCMLREMMLVMKRYEREHHSCLLSHYRSAEMQIANDYTIAKSAFRMYPQQNGMERLKNRYKDDINIAVQQWFRKRQRTHVSVSVGKHEPKMRKGPFRGDYTVFLSWGWYYKVWRDIYGKEYSSAYDGRIVVDAERIRLPDREFDFFKVRYIDIGEDDVKDGWAARSRDHPVVVVCHHSMRIIDRANIALSEYIMGELTGEAKQKK